MDFRQALLIAAVAGLGPRSAEACTTFALDGPEGPVVAKSYDWHTEDGLLIANPKGLRKSALVLSGSPAAAWVSKYSSLTFNQYGHEFPNGGMNEAGLVVEIMWLDQTQHEVKDQRPAINELQWIQMQLDLHGSVKEVVAHLSEVRVEGVSGKVHYMVCDKSGACATVEHLGGRLVLHKSVRPRALTNHPYAVSVAHLKKAGAIKGRGSLARFVRAARASSGTYAAPVPAAFEVLKSVRIPGYSKWWIVYEPAALKVHFATAQSRSVKTVSLREAMPACAQGPQAMPMAISGPLVFTPLSAEQNQGLVRASLAKSRDKRARHLGRAISKISRSFKCVGS